MISSKNIFYHELIGLELKVVDSSNPSLIGLCGTVIDETKKTLLIEVKEEVENQKGETHKESTEDLSSNQNDFNFIYKEKLIQKDVSVFQFKVPDGTIVEIDGKILLNRPEDRIKKRYKKI
jgi:ribonuclease P protein subunit POP4